MCQPQSFLGQHEVVGDASLLLKHHHQKLHTDLEKLKTTIKNYIWERIKTIHKTHKIITKELIYTEHNWFDFYPNLIIFFIFVLYGSDGFCS